MAEIFSNVKRKVLKMREELYKIRNVLSNLHCLHAEAAALSRFLYRNYRALRKDRGFQLLKMVMTSLNKYLRMDVVGSIDTMRHALPPRFPILAEKEDLPSQTAVGWLLSRIQALAALFYRIVQLSKRAGKFLYMRLRLNWNPAVLILCLGMAARIHVISRYLVLEAVSWYSSITPHLRTFTKVNNNPYLHYPRDLKAWLGGLQDLVAPAVTPTSTLDMVFQLIDLTEEDQEEDDDRGFVRTIKDLNVAGSNDSEVERLYEVVALDTSTRSEQEQDEDDEELSVEFESVQKRIEAEDIGEAVIIDSVETRKQKRKRKDSSRGSTQLNHTKKKKGSAVPEPRRQQEQSKKSKLGTNNSTAHVQKVVGGKGTKPLSKGDKKRNNSKIKKKKKKPKISAKKAKLTM